MKKKAVVIFPDTVPAAQVLIPLVPVFEPVVYCQPVENDDHEETLDQMGRAMVEGRLCQVHAPAPLEENRERFLRLVQDLQQRRDDYAAQLAHVSLAGMSTGGRPVSESRSTILSRLLSGHGIDSAEQELREKILWQARLVLKLGEQFDRDQKRVDEDMQSIHQREQNLFAGLSSGSDNLFSLTGRLSSPAVAESDRMQRLRLKAWSRLYAFGPNPMAEARYFVTTDPDALDRLREEFERDSGRAPASFLNLPLPCRHPDPARFLEQLRNFQKEESALVQKYQELLDDPSANAGPLKDWSAAMGRYFPQHEYGRCQLFLYAFSGIRLQQLFLASFGHDEDELETAISGESPRDIIVGLLAEQ